MKKKMVDKESILIVDDDENVRMSLVQIFREYEYETEEAKTGQEAIEKVKERFFNVVLLDIKLPDMDGIELIAPIKGKHPDTVVIMITGYASVDTAVRSLHKEASAYIIKPMEIDKLLSTIRDALEKQRLMIENKRLLKEIQQELTERKQADEELKSQLGQLEVFYRATVGREGRVIELKHEVNKLLKQLGKKKKYGI